MTEVDPVIVQLRAEMGELLTDLHCPDTEAHEDVLL